MGERRAKCWAIWLSSVLFCGAAPESGSITALEQRGLPAIAGAVLARAHAHNDYENARPLLDALDNGFTSIEVDVWLHAGQLVVAHSFPEFAAGTLEQLYLAPLEARLREQQGRVYAEWPHSVQLLIDIKSNAELTYRALHQALARYSALLTRFEHGERTEGPVTVVISGNRPLELMRAQALRYAAYDGRSCDLSLPLSAAFMPLVSNAWYDLFSWRGVGAMPHDERERLKTFVSAAHARGQRVRFWGTPDAAPRREALWKELLSAGVDYINTDHVLALRHFLSQHGLSQHGLGQHQATAANTPPG
jgi:glycerophosphoryl diester phosphodiesterase